MLTSNLLLKQYKQNKGFCEDLTEGKFSFPIVHSIRADTSNQRLLSVLFLALHTSGQGTEPLRNRRSTTTADRYRAENVRSHIHG